jgi:biopolymer transport protein TolR
VQLSSSKKMQSDLNITPLIDVVLVLLIIFMVVVPSVEARFLLAVPDTEEPEDQEPDDENQPLVVKLEADGSTTLNSEQLPLEQLIEKLRQVLRQRADKVVFFDAADQANFGIAVDVMDACRGAGARHIGVIEPDLGNEQAGGTAPAQP